MSTLKKTRQIEISIFYEGFIEIEKKGAIFKKTIKRQIEEMDVEDYLVEFFSKFNPKPTHSFINNNCIELTFKFDSENDFETLEKGVDIRNKLKKSWDNKKIPIRSIGNIHEPS